MNPGPILIDVTPRGLVVETAGGFTDVLIPRNAHVPCERTRTFSTARDGQTSVRIRVGQGEARMFRDTTYLGEIVLDGLPKQERGVLSVSVSFELDEGGLLKVSARDAATGKRSQATLMLQGVASDERIDEMAKRLEATTRN
jgi:molecular chaperone DnaK